MAKILLCLFTLILASCAHLDIHRNEPLPNREGTQIQMRSFLWGFAPGPRLQPVSTFCQNGQFEAAQLTMSGQDVLLTTITLGLYVPHRVTIYCGK